MAYKTIRRDGRNITIDTATGKEVGVGQGALKPLFDTLGLSNLSETLPLTLKQTAADIQNLPRDIGRHLIYSDKVDEKGRPLTIAQAYPQKRQLIPEIESYLGRNGKSDQNKPVYGQLDPSVNTNLAAYDEGVTLPGSMHGQLPDDYKNTEQKAGQTAENFRPGAGFGSQQLNGTVTSPNSGNMPMNWAQYEEFLNNYGLTADEKKSGKRNITLSGFESNNLPGGSKPSITTKPAVGISQAGASSEADINDQSRAHEVDQTKNRALPRGARQRQKFLERNPDYGKKETPKPDKGGLSARSKAFLAYEGKGGSLGAVRAADASQNLMRYGDRFAVKVGDNDYKEISREGADKIRGDMRDQKEFSQEFLSNYLATPAKPADAQSEDAVQPKPATKDLTTMAESYKPEFFPNELGFNISYNDEIPDMGLDPKLFSYVRFPSKK